MTIPPGIKIRVLPRFPGRVDGGAGITVTKSGGVWTFAQDFMEIADATTLPNEADTWMLVWDNVTGSFVRVSIDTIASLIGVPITTVAQHSAVGDYTMLAADDIIIVDKAAGAATTVNLVTAVGRDNRPIKIVDGKGDADVNAITVDAAGGETIIGQVTYIINFAYGTVTLYPLPSGAGWFI